MKRLILLSLVLALVPGMAWAMNLSPNPVRQGQTAVFSGQLVDNHKNPFAGQTLEVLGGWGSPTATKTAANGDFTAVLTAQNPGSWPVSVQVNGATLQTGQTLDVVGSAPVSQAAATTVTKKATGGQNSPVKYLEAIGLIGLGVGLLVLKRRQKR